LRPMAAMAEVAGGDPMEVDGIIHLLAERMVADDLAHGAEAARQLHLLASGDDGGADQMRSRVGQSPLLIEALRRLLLSGSDMARYWCCRCITTLSHHNRVCDKHTANQVCVHLVHTQGAGCRVQGAGCRVCGGGGVYSHMCGGMCVYSHMHRVPRTCIAFLTLLHCRALLPSTRACWRPSSGC
jgi:hypothetical protein